LAKKTLNTEIALKYLTEILAEWKKSQSTEIKYWDNGNKKCEKWMKDDKLHHEDGPAILYYFRNGKISTEGWQIDDKLHRKDGPAHIEYNEKGEITKEVYYEDGKEIKTITYNR
jgi:antitoxin component YwqK of YwqJK toxin-antitoxin module